MYTYVVPIILGCHFSIINCQGNALKCSKTFSVCICIVFLEDFTGVTVFTNEKAVFSCLASDVTSFNWRVNETDIDMLPHQLRNDIKIEDIFDFDISTLTLKARVAYNGTRIQCVVTGEHGSLESDIATLTIQGIWLISCNKAIRGL